jgi:uncharacterized membrane-anchored protein YitT (DUF2179 family)
VKPTGLFSFLKTLRGYLGKDRAEKISDYTLARQSINFKDNMKIWLKDSIFLSFGILSAGFGLKGFLLPNDFIDGGVTGISLLTSAVTGYPLPILIVIINIPFIILGYFQIGKMFVFKSILAIVGLAIALTFINYPIITSDKLLVSVFGGFFLGAGIGLSVRGGAVLDGTEVLAIYLGRLTGLTIGDLILVFNIFIFSTAAYLLSIEIALYAILTYLAASKTVDFVIEGVEEYIGVIIISKRSESLRIMITEKMGRGVTLYQGSSGYGPRENLTDTEIIYSVITRLEIGSLQNAVKKIDPEAFIVMNSVKDLKGGMIKKRQFKH